ncbi:Mrp/NBP35 family ATP-binding protein [candidate division KSB1 bacterium]|nr:Mrp/NBP35 family ATP-binding protein [candidate division KSB1 bacterium]
MNADSTRAKSIEDQDKRIEAALEKIKHRIVVFSGKGGVGKTTVAVNLAYTLLKQNNKVGLLDADITGPNVPKMTGAEVSPQVLEEFGQIIPHEQNGLKIMSIAPMLPKDSPLIWRGPLRSGAICQFLADVVWDELDFLLADLPPGTGDEVLTAAQKMKPQMAIVVTTPQEVSLIDCRRAVNMAKKLDIPNIGVVENMSGLICPHCDQQIDVFGTGGGEMMAADMKVHFLGRIPMELSVRQGCDAGKPIVLEDTPSKTSEVFEQISGNIDKILSE